MNKQSSKLASLSLAFMVLLSVFAGSAAFAGTAAAANAEDYEFDANLEDDGTYWVGQTLYSDETENSGDGTTYEIRDVEDEQLAKQVNVNEEGALIIDTDELDEEKYFVEDSNNVEQYAFSVVDQEFEVETSDDDTSDTTYTIEFDSNRVDFGVIVEASGLDADELEDIFGEENGEVSTDEDGDDQFVLTDVNDGDELDATFDEEDAGEYDFTFTVEDTDKSDSVEDFTVTEPDDSNAEFTKSVYSEEKGDVASFNITFDNSDRADVMFGDEEDTGYEIGFTVVDGNDDDEVEVEFNTFTAGDGDSSTTVSAADSEDSIEFDDHDDETDIGEYYLSEYTYTMSLEVNDEEEDIASLRLNERETIDATTYVVPSSEDTNDAEEIRDNAVEGDTVALGDKLVVEFEASGIFAQLEDKAAGDLANESSFDVDNGINVVVKEQDDSVINRDAETLDVSKSTLRQDADNNTFYLVFDSDEYELEDDEEYDVALNLTEDNPYINNEDDEETASTSFSIADRTAEFDDYDDGEELVYVPAEDNYNLEGTTTVAPGTELTVIARAEGDAPFLYSDDVIVSNDGTFGAEFDFGNLSESDEFTVSVRGFGEEDAEIDRVGTTEYDFAVDAVNADDEEVEANFTIDGEAYDGETTLTNGTYTVEATADGYADASQEVTIDGEGTTATIQMELPPEEYDLSVSAVDENDESVDADITVDGESASDGIIALENGTYTVEATADGYEVASEEVTIDGDSQSIDLTLTEEEEPSEPEPSEGESNSSNDSGESDDPGQPGFGAFVALVAILGALFLAGRQD